MTTTEARTVRPSDVTAADLFDYIDAAPSPHHAVVESAARLTAAGYSEVNETEAWPSLPGRWFVKRRGALVAWQRPDGARAGTPMRLVGAHTDSPNLRLKPRPDVGKAGYQQVAVEVYGGALLNSWLDRDLGLSGRVVFDSGSGQESLLVRIDEPLARVAQLAIHLDREVNDGLRLDKQLHMTPLWGLGDSGNGDVLAFVARYLDRSAADIVSADLMFHDLTPCSVIGADRSMYAAPRIDNLASCHAATLAMVGLEPETVAVMALFDHEEVGSTSATGANGAMLGHLLERIELATGGNRESYLRSLASSWCLSADGAHAVHPNYLDRYEPGHHVILNGGPVLKVNANVRYATEADGIAVFRAAAKHVGVPVQQYSHRTNLACGSTIGPLSAAELGISTIDVGSPQLSMHSARELGGINDPAMLTDAIGAFLTSAS